MSHESAVDFVARTEKKEVVNETADGILVNLHLRHVAIAVRCIVMSYEAYSLPYPLRVGYVYIYIYELV